MTSCNQCPLWLPRMQDLQSLTLRWRSFSGWGRECLTSYFEHKGSLFIQKEHQRTFIYTLRSTVWYLNATINRATWNAKPEIGPDGSDQTRRNLRVDRYGATFGQPTTSRSGFWTVLEPNWKVFVVQPRNAGGLPGPVAHTRCGIAGSSSLTSWIGSCPYNMSCGLSTGIPNSVKSPFFLMTSPISSNCYLPS